MNLLGFDELLEKLREADESVQIEAKRAEEFGNRILETVSSFCNEPGRAGGYLVLGVGMPNDALFPVYEIFGVSNPDKLQADLATKCREMFSVPIRPQIKTETRNGKTVVVAYIPEAQPHEKPVYLKSKGLPNGAFRRIGSTNQHCTDEDLAMFYQLRRNEKIAAVLHDAGLAETKGTGISAMRDAMAQANLTAPLFESDREKDTFTVTLLVYHLFGPQDLKWLSGFKDCSLSEDEARALIFVREVGAINNSAYRDINRLDTLTASGHLRRLRDLDLLEQKGKGASQTSCRSG
jgi:ATP-dependent DNA helicase RecG